MAEEAFAFDERTANEILRIVRREMARYGNGPAKRSTAALPAERMKFIAEVIPDDGITGIEKDTEGEFTILVPDYETPGELIETEEKITAWNRLARLVPGRRVLIEEIDLRLEVVAILAGGYKDLVHPDDVSNGWGADWPGIVTTSAPLSSSEPRTYVVDSLVGLIEKSLGGSEGDDLYVVCVKRPSSIESVFLKPLSAFETT